MGQDPRQTVVEIEQAREELGRKVDLLVGRAKAEAGEIGRKVAIGAVAIVGLVVVGMIAKRRVQR